MGFVGHAFWWVAINSNGIGVRVESDQWGCRLEHCLALEGQVGMSPGGRTQEVLEKSFHAMTNLVGSKERQKEVGHSTQVNKFWPTSSSTSYHHLHSHLPRLPYQDLGNDDLHDGSLAPPGEISHHLSYRIKRYKIPARKYQDKTKNSGATMLR